MMKDMTTGNPTKLIFLFAMPMLIGNLFQQFYTMIDAVIVGKFVSVDALAAVGATNSVNFFIDFFDYWTYEWDFCRSCAVFWI
ncbi:hypothetical protein G161_11936 [Listeria monocytogenes FSL F6-684]|nr:hypothetical protein G161_11936 [Listeria monocytogenes FSL F6-684]